jgi:anthranilate synthase component II
VTVLIVDNYDSFTWNLHQLVGSLGGAPRVARNDEITVDQVRRLAPTHIVFSPGPGRPDDARRVGVCMNILEDEPLAHVPILGVCLGHQAIVHAFGGRVVRGAPVHGKTSVIEHAGDTILEDLPRPFAAMRYHSLVADPASIPTCLAVTAWCKDGTVMAVRHRGRPVFGVQFHPESIGTADGRTLVSSFLSSSGDHA